MRLLVMKNVPFFRFDDILLPILKLFSHVWFLNPRNEREEPPLHKEI